MIRIPEHIAGVRVPKKIRKAAARLPQPSRPMALAAVGSAIAAGLVASLRRRRHHPS